jgi:hypothetical protein
VTTRLYEGPLTARERRDLVCDAGAGATGLYFVSSVGNGFVATKKVIILR